MFLTDPLPFEEALEARRVRTLLPTELRSQMLNQLSDDLRERAMFSAGVTHAEFLQMADDGIAALLQGATNRAAQRTRLRGLLDLLSYRPEEGEEGTITDLRSDQRLNLILDTNTQMAQGYGGWQQGQDPEVLNMWPAQELVRVIEPAGDRRDWHTRWTDAGGQIFNGRMIALKDDPIWTRLGPFGLPYPPFDYNSGMDVSDVTRRVAMELGLIDLNTRVQPQTRDFNADLQASPDVRASGLRESLSDALEGIAAFDAQGVLRFNR